MKSCSKNRKSMLFYKGKREIIMIEENIVKQIREHFKTFTPIDIADATHLFGINFDTDSIESILDSVIALYREVKNLRDLIGSNFMEDSEEKVLVPKDKATQDIVIENCYRKQVVLNKALSNEYVLKMVKARIKEQEKECEEKQGNIK